MHIKGKLVEGTKRNAPWENAVVKYASDHGIATYDAAEQAMQQEVALQQAKVREYETLSKAVDDYWRKVEKNRLPKSADQIREAVALSVEHKLSYATALLIVKGEKSPEKLAAEQAKSEAERAPGGVLQPGRNAFGERVARIAQYSAEHACSWDEAVKACNAKPEAAETAMQYCSCENGKCTCKPIVTA
jgi:hypothetical protein